MIVRRLSFALFSVFPGGLPGWATSLSAGESDSSREYAFFSVGIELTQEGQGEVDLLMSHMPPGRRGDFCFMSDTWSLNPYTVVLSKCGYFFHSLRFLLHVKSTDIRVAYA